MIPIVLFAYDRPQHLLRTLQGLRANRVPKIYAFSDAPKTAQAAARVAEVRRLLRAIDWCDCVLVERDENLGLGRSIRAGVAAVFADHEAVLVFEDDLVCVEGAYDYLTAALEQYKNDPRVLSVSGWAHPSVTPADVGDSPYFDGRMASWLWGAWRRSWEGMDEDAQTLIDRCRARGIDPARCGADLLHYAAVEHQWNIWAVRFALLHFLNGGLSLRPPRSLVEHIGFGPEATNATDGTQWASAPLGACPPIPSHWPEPIEHPGCAPLARLAYHWEFPQPAPRRRVRALARRAVPDALVRWIRRR